MMIIQDENRLKEGEEEEKQEHQEVEEEQEASRMSTEMNSTVKAAEEEGIHDLSLSNGKKTVSPDLGKSANRRKQVKPNR